MPMTKIEQIARAVLNLERVGSYKSSFEKVFFNKSKHNSRFTFLLDFINSDELGQLISRSGMYLDRQELNSLFNYLAIDNFS